ncbi:MAG: T9SS type A sorting domain-containing protein, partial [Candidatus Eisenbacteria bacterium]
TRASVAVGPAEILTPSISNAFPNPTRGGVGFSLVLPGPANVSVRILDVQGRRVWSAATRRYDAGRWSLAWDGRTAGRSAPAGVYLARIQAGGRVWSRSITIVR